MRRRVALALAAALAAPLAWVLGSAGEAPPADPADSRQVALGRTVDAEHSAACHGAALEGEPDWETRRPDGRMPACG